MNRSRPDEITLKENIIGRAKVIDDTLVDDFGGFGVEEFFADPAPVEENLPPVLGQDELAADRDPPPLEGDNLNDRNGQPLSKGVETANDKVNAIDNDMGVDDLGPADFGGADSSPDPQAVADIGPPALPNGEDPPETVEAEAPAPTETANGQKEKTPVEEGIHDNTTLINPAEGFALGPRETLRPAKENARAKKRRKLIVDRETVISSDRMRAQLQDCSDIVRSLDMAPSTARLMYLRETSAVDKLWNKPGMYYDDGVGGMSSKLTDLFMQQLAPVVPQGGDETDDFFPETLGDDLMSSITRYSNRMLDIDHGNEIGGNDIDALAENQGYAIVPETDLPIMPEDPYPVDAEPVPSPGKRNKRTHNAAGSPTGPDDTPRPTKRRAGVEIEDEEESVNGDPEEEEPHPEDHDKMSRRTKQVLDQFSTLLARRHTPRHSNPDGSQSVNFEDLTRGHRTRKEVAQRFYSTLVLKKLQVIDVEQEKPYGDIWLKKGGRYEEFAV